MTVRGGAAVLAATAMVIGATSWAALTQARSVTEWRSAHRSLIARTEVGAARIGDRVYVVGGYKGPSGEVTGALERYDISSDSWRTLRPLPIAVDHAGVTAAGGKLYVTGGFFANGVPTDRLYR